jgi:hypothetical protein
MVSRLRRVLPGGERALASQSFDGASFAVLEGGRVMYSVRRRGMGDATYYAGSPACSNINALNSTQINECSLWGPGSTYCTYMPNWLMSSAQLTACTISTPSVVPAPTQAQTDACAAAADPGACAAALVQTLTNQAVTDTQANNNAAVAATPNNPYVQPVPSFILDPAGDLPGDTAWCGPNSTSWIPGIDNCTLLEIGAAVIVGLIVLGAVKGARL